MDEYTYNEFIFRRVAKKGDWSLYKGTKDKSYHIYELVRIIDNQYPKSNRWGKDGFTFLSIEDALRAMKILLDRQ